MNPDKISFSPKTNFDSIIAGLLGALLVFFYTKHGGIGLEPDSVVYLSTARSVMHSGTFYEFENIPLTDFPIGYPAFLGLILLISRVDLLQSGPVINMFLWFGFIYLSGGILNNLTNYNKWVKVPFLFLIAFSPVLLYQYIMLLSETLFLVMTLLFLVALYRYGRDKTVRNLLAVGLIAGTACVVRYAGVSLVGAGGLVILLDRKIKPGKKVAHLFLFGTTGILFLMANLIRNKLASGMLTGEREKSLTSLYQNIQNYACVLGDFFCFHRFPMGLAALVGVSFILFYFCLFSLQVFKTDHYYGYWNICVAFFIVYSLFIISSATFSRFEPLDMRLLSPLYIPCLLPFSYIIPRMISRFHGWWKYGLVSVFVLLFIEISYSQYKDNRELYEMAKDCGIPGYGEDGWKYSPLLKYINQDKQHFREGTKIYSDGNEAVYLFTGFSADLVPHVESAGENANFKEEQQNEYYLVWFYENADPELLSLEKLLKEHEFRQVAAFPEGCIYFHPAPDPEKNFK
jgi:hypothetical protein